MQNTMYFLIFAIVALPILQYSVELTDFQNSVFFILRIATSLLLIILSVISIVRSQNNLQKYREKTLQRKPNDIY